MTIILRDGIAVANTPDWFHWLISNCPYSTDHALEHEGYSLFNDGDGAQHTVHQAWVDYLRLAASAHTYSVTGFIVHTIERVQALTLLADTTDDAYLARRVILPMLRAINEGLNFLTGPVSVVGAELSTWVMSTLRRWNLSEDDL